MAPKPKDPQVAANMPAEKQTPVKVSTARRRLSVDGNNWILDGDKELHTESKEDIVVPKGDQMAPQGDQMFRVYAGKSQKGYIFQNPRKVNQDTLLIHKDEATKSLILGTFDGHGEHGHCVSGVGVSRHGCNFQFISEHFLKYLMEHEKWTSDMKTAAVESLLRAEKECIESSTNESSSGIDRFIKTDFSGTTAVICIIRDDYLLTLNVGDSRAIIVTEVGDDFTVTELTRDHKPSIPEEKERIEKAGGRVFNMEYEDGYDGPARVWLADQNIPGLAMSRSLCDTVAHTVGVISMPEITERKLTDDERAIVIGSDGLWEFISSKEAIRLIQDCKDPEVGTYGMDVMR